MSTFTKGQLEAMWKLERNGNDSLYAEVKELKRRIRLARAALNGVGQFGSNYWVRGPEALRALDLRRPLKKRRT